MGAFKTISKGKDHMALLKKVKKENGRACVVKVRKPLRKVAMALDKMERRARMADFLTANNEDTVMSGAEDIPGNTLYDLKLVGQRSFNVYDALANMSVVVRVERPAAQSHADPRVPDLEKRAAEAEKRVEEAIRRAELAEQQAKETLDLLEEERRTAKLARDQAAEDLINLQQTSTRQLEEAVKTSTGAGQQLADLRGQYEAHVVELRQNLVAAQQAQQAAENQVAVSEGQLQEALEASNTNQLALTALEGQFLSKKQKLSSTAAELTKVMGERDQQARMLVFSARNDARRNSELDAAKSKVKELESELAKANLTLSTEQEKLQKRVKQHKSRNRKIREEFAAARQRDEARHSDELAHQSGVIEKLEIDKGNVEQQLMAEMDLNELLQEEIVDHKQVNENLKEQGIQRMIDKAWKQFSPEHILRHFPTDQAKREWRARFEAIYSGEPRQEKAPKKEEKRRRALEDVGHKNDVDGDEDMDREDRPKETLTDRTVRQLQWVSRDGRKLFDQTPGEASFAPGAPVLASVEQGETQPGAPVDLDAVAANLGELDLDNPVEPPREATPERGPTPEPLPTYEGKGKGRATSPVEPGLMHLTVRSRPLPQPPGPPPKPPGEDEDEIT